MADPDVDNDHLHNQLVDDDVDGDGDVVDDVDGIDVDGIDYFVNDVVDFVDIDVRRLSDHAFARTGLRIW